MAFVQKEAQYVLTDIHVRLLRLITGNKFISSENWTDSFKSFLEQLFPDKYDLTFNSYWDLDYEVKV